MFSVGRSAGGSDVYKRQAVPCVVRMRADAVVARDFPMVQGGVLVVAAMVVVVNGVTDVVAGLLDPRVGA